MRSWIRLRVCPSTPLPKRLERGVPEHLPTWLMASQILEWQIRVPKDGRIPGHANRLAPSLKLIHKEIQ